MSEGKYSREQKRSFIMGLVSGLVVIGVLGGVFMLGANYGGGGFGSLAQGNNNQPTVPTQPTNPSLPEVDVTKIAKVTNVDHIRGNANAKITLVEYSDFECPFCASFHPTVKQLLADYPNDIRLVYRHFPLRQLHPNAQKAAEASECAAEQGKFWEMHDKLFELNTARSLTLDAMKTAAKDMGLDTTKFNSCVDSGKYASEVEKDYKDGIAGGVTGTPGTFVGSEYVAGALPYESVKAVVEAQL